MTELEGTFRTVKGRVRGWQTPFRIHLIWLLVAVTTIDRIITLFHWEHEANPLVASMGPTNWLIVTLLLLAGLLLVWYWNQLWRSWIAILLTLTLTIGTAWIIRLNIAVLV